MKAMVLDAVTNMAEDQRPLKPRDLPEPKPVSGEVLIQVSACAVCHTELDEIEGRTLPPKLPVVPGHQVVGRVVALGSGVEGIATGDRVGVAWIYSACGTCRYCVAGFENLCEQFKATGRDVDGGYAEYMVVPAEFSHHIPEVISDVDAAPLLCAGAIGFRSLRLAGIRDGDNVGLMGFGASGHLVMKLIHSMYPRTNVFVFARGEAEQEFARSLGAVWTGNAEALAPERLDSVIDTTPAWKPIVESLRNLRPGGRLVVNAIRKEEADKEQLLQLDYPLHLWMEKEIKSVANVTRADVREFLGMAAKVPITPEVELFALEEANVALRQLKQRKIKGAKVLRIG